MMSNAEVTPEKHRVVGIPWKPGQSGNPNGRPRGSRNRLSDQFVADLATAWERHGVEALEKCATTEPGTFLKVVASLMPKTVDLNVGLNAADFVMTFRQARAVLGNEPQRLRRGSSNGPVTIEPDDAG
jgi:hypothetical protein